MKRIIVAGILLFVWGLYAQCTATIDSAWFSQEALCDGSDIVLVCYDLSSTCSGESFAVNVQMSGDGGVTWDIPMNTLADTTGDLGSNVSPGNHCFFWLMDEDTIAEGVDWLLDVRVLLELDTFEIVNTYDDGFDCYGWGLAWEDGTFYVYERSETGRVFACPDNPTMLYCPVLDLIATHDYIILGRNYNCDIDVEDGWLYYCSNVNGLVADDTLYRINVETRTRQVLHIFPYAMNINGVEVIDSFIYLSDLPTDTLGPGFNTISRMDMRDLPSMTRETFITLPMSLCGGIEGMAYANGFLWGSSNDFNILKIDINAIPPELVACYPVDYSVALGAEGLCFDGWYLWYYDSDSIHQIMIYDTVGTRFQTTSALDSDPPKPMITCPTSSVPSGDSLTLGWTVDDLFPGSRPSDVTFEYGGVSESFTASGSEFRWLAPASCDSIRAIVEVRDFYCNYGWDTCSFAVCIPPDTRLNCPTFWSFTSCTTQGVMIVVQDTLCSGSIDNAWLTMTLFHEVGGSETFPFDASSPEMTITDLIDSTVIELGGTAFTSGDSVSVTLDSLLGASGCIFVP